jgi:hypothetical protein
LESRRLIYRIENFFIDTAASSNELFQAIMPETLPLALASVRVPHKCGPLAILHSEDDLVAGF